MIDFMKAKINVINVKFRLTRSLTHVLEKQISTDKKSKMKFLKTYDAGQLNQDMFGSFFTGRIESIPCFIEQMNEDSIMLNDIPVKLLNVTQYPLLRILELQNDVSTLHNFNPKWNIKPYLEIGHSIAMYNTTELTKIDTEEKILRLYKNLKKINQTAYLYIFEKIE